MKVINIVTQKGGTGKTETCKNLALGLAKKGKRVLVIDLDPQANTTTNLLQTSKVLDSKAMQEMKAEFDIMMKELEANDEKPSGVEGIDIIHRYTKRYSDAEDTSTVLLTPTSIKEAIKHTKYDNLDIIPSSSQLMETDIKLKSACIGSDSRLSTALDIVKNDYDAVIIDHSPFINALTINGIIASKNEGDLIIIPVKLESASLDGMDTVFQQMIEILNYSYLGFDFKLLFTMRNRNKNERELEKTLRYLFPDRCFNTTIRYQAKPVNEASANKEVLIENSHSNVANDYNMFVDECIELF